MRSLMTCVATLAALTIGATTAHAQAGVQFGIGGGASLPMSDFNDVAKLGYHGMVLVGFQGPARIPVGLRLDGLFQRAAQDPNTDDQTFQTLGGNADLVYAIKVSDASKIRPYIMAGGGYLGTKLTEGNTPNPGVSNDYIWDFNVNGGVGFNFVVGKIGVFLEGRYFNVFTEGSDLQFIPITLGVRFGSSEPTSNGM